MEHLYIISGTCNIVRSETSNQIYACLVLDHLYVSLLRQLHRLGRALQTWSHGFMRKNFATSRSLDRLHPVSIADLVANTTHKEQLLWCRVATRCQVFKSGMLLVEDDAGDITMLAVYGTEAQHFSQADKLFSKGLRMAIKEPYFKVFADGTKGIRVDDVNDLVLDTAVSEQVQGAITH